MILLSKEFRSLLSTPVGLVFLLVFLSITGLLLWAIPGMYHIPENGYASLDAFFLLAPVILTVLIPAFSVSVFSEEKKHRTLELLLTRPVSVYSIVMAKTLAVLLIVLLAFLLSAGYLFTISYYAIPQGNVDWGAIGGSYFGMLFLSLTFVSITVLASSLTSNQVMAFILALFGCAGCYYGFDLLSALFADGRVQLFVQQLGLLSHLTSMQRGVIDSRDLAALVAVAACCFLLTCYVLSAGKNKKMLYGSILILLLTNVLSAGFHGRWDLTDEKRYTIGNSSVSILKTIEKPLTFDVYLDGDLNAGFTRLKHATVDILSEFARVSPEKIHVRLIDPYQSDDKDFIAHLNSEGIGGIAVNERDRAGKVTQRIVFPWLKITDEEAHISVPLLVHAKNKSGEENLNASIENIEYQLISNIYRLTEKKQRKIVFLEGHAELSEQEVGNVAEMLSNYYQIDRGTLSNDVYQLSEYECVIIAGSQMPFSEQEKFILDQYLMRGGRLLFLINGVKILPEKLAADGRTPSMVNDVNLDDLLFTYGVRINPVLVEDQQCLTIPVQTTATDGETGDLKPLPWYFAPILYPATDHPITKNVMLVKAEFVSNLSFVGQQTTVRATPLLSTSGHGHLVAVPEMITLQSSEENRDIRYFQEQPLVVAALLEGTFTSVFNHRSVPAGINTQEIIRESVPAKIMVAGAEELIRNETEHTSSGEKYLPVGYDKYLDVQLDNSDFLINTVNYLTDHKGLMVLKDKHLKIRLLDKNRWIQSGYLPIAINLFVPLFVVLGLFFVNRLIRRKKYFKW